MVDPNFVAYTQGVATPLWRQIPDSLLRTRGLLAAPAACARPHDVGWPLCFFLCVSGSASVCARVCVGWGGAALVTGLLCVDPAQRLTIQQVRRHAWFTEYACRRARAALPRRADGPRTRAHAASYDRAPVIWGIQALLALGCWYRVFCFFSLAPSRRSSPRAWTRPPPLPRAHTRADGLRCQDPDRLAIELCDSLGLDGRGPTWCASRAGLSLWVSHRSCLMA